MDADVLVVGAGPTGLSLAAQLAAHGVMPRVIDRAPDRAHESRALAIQPRTLEVLAPLELSDRLVAAGNPTTRLCLHTRGTARSVPLFDLDLEDTAYPYLLFLSQAETERILAERLAGAGVEVERGVELVRLDPATGGVTAGLRHRDGTEETVRAAYVVGCDGAHSAVRRLAGIGFEGGAYPQTFVLADLEADGIEPDVAHAFLSETGIFLAFPLAHPATWRLIAMRPPDDHTPPDSPVTLEHVQALADSYTGGALQVRDPVWMTNFRLHHRAATRYRDGRVFLAGDAAHIHSPAGAQGMNTGIQDAINLGWKLAYAVRGLAPPEVLDTYHPERAPVGRFVLRFTDRAFRIATSAGGPIGLLRARVAPALIPLAQRARAARAYAFRTLAQLRITYRHSPLSTDGPAAPRSWLRAGDRLPDHRVVCDGRSTTLHRVVASPGWHLLLCGPPGEPRPSPPVAGRIAVHHVAASRQAQFLIRPDGHIGYRAGGTDFTGLVEYLKRWSPAV